MSEKEDDFYEYLKSKGEIKDVSEAFEKYPVEEEWHKGKIESFSYLQEVREKYHLNLYEIGDIVFVKKYKYNDGTEGKNHLFVIVGQNNIAVPIENFGMIISSKIEKAKYSANKILKKDYKNKLNKDSIVKTDEVYKITNDQILFKIGTIDMEKIEEYKESYKNRK